MTPPWRERCPSCGASTEQPIDAWIRTHPELESKDKDLYICDGDKWVHRFAVRRRGTRDRSVQYLMSIEIKTHDAAMKPSQRDTLHDVNQLIRTEPWREQRERGRFLPGHRQNVRMVWSAWQGKKVQLLCYGIHVLRLSGATPDDSERMTWDGQDITADDLVQLLAFRRNPDAPRRMIEDRHHKYTPPAQPTLFGEHS